MSKEAAALIVVHDAMKFKDNPIEESLNGIMELCHDHWIGGQAFFGLKEEFGLFLTVLQMVYKDDQEVSWKIQEEIQGLKNLQALISGVPVDIERMAAESQCHYQLNAKWAKKWEKELKSA